MEKATNSVQQDVPTITPGASRQHLTDRGKKMAHRRWYSFEEKQPKDNQVIIVLTARRKRYRVVALADSCSGYDYEEKMWAFEKLGERTPKGVSRRIPRNDMLDVNGCCAHELHEPPVAWTPDIWPSIPRRRFSSRVGKSGRVLRK